jgi:hypothetical protein
MLAALWACQLALGWLAGRHVATLAASALHPFAVLDDGQMLGYLLQFLGRERAVSTALATGIVAAALISAVFWTAVAPGIIARLAGRETFVASVARHLPGAAVTSLWHLLFAALGGGVIAVAAAQLPTAAALPLVLVFVAWRATALDLARCDVVLAGARPYHPKTALVGFVRAARSPRVLVPSAILSAGAWAVVAATGYFALLGASDGSGPVAARALALLGLVLGVGRMAVAVEACASADEGSSP